MTTDTPTGLEYAKLLAHALARIEQKPAYVVNDNGHAMLAVELDFEETALDRGYWTQDQIIFKADAPTP